MGNLRESDYRITQKHPYIDGIFAGNDVMAFGVMKAAEKVGRKIPHNLQVVGFDGICLSEMLTPSLTTISQPIEEMGRKSSELLLTIIEGTLPLEYPKPFKGSLKIRSSTLNVRRREHDGT